MSYLETIYKTLKGNAKYYEQVYEFIKAYIEANPITAENDMGIQTGTYTGSGGAQTIDLSGESGFNHILHVIIVIDDAAEGAGVNNYMGIGVLAQVNDAQTDGQNTAGAPMTVSVPGPTGLDLDVEGSGDKTFDVGGSLDSAAVDYHYIAITDKD